MKNKNSRFFLIAGIITTLLFIGVGVVLITNSRISADVPTPAFPEGVSITPAAATGSFSGAGTTGDYTSGFFGTGSLPEYIDNFYGWALGVGIALAIFMIVWGGYTYATSAGDIEKINDAKEKIIGAVLGIILLALAAIILSTIGVSTLA